MKHINTEDIVQYFTPSEVKHFLPFHQPDLISNIFTITEFYIKNAYGNNLILSPDQTLTTPSHPHYSQILMYWHQDFDNTEEHLRQSLELGTTLVNLFHTLSCQKNQLKVQTFERVDTIENQQLLIITPEKVEKGSLRYANLANNRALINYNYIKKNNNIVMIFGVVGHLRDNLCTMLGNLRQWNINRLAPSKLSQYSIDRTAKVLNHLFSTGRGFIRQVADDYNTNHINLQNFLNNLLSNQNSHQRILEMSKQHRLFDYSIIYNIKTYKKKLMYKSNLTEELLWQIICQCVTEMLLQAPKNISCTYSSVYAHDEDRNQITLMIAVHYINGKEKNVTDDDIDTTFQQVQGFLIAERQKKKKKPTQMDNRILDSMGILRKYGQQEKKKDVEASHIWKLKGESGQNRMSQSFISNVSSISEGKKINLKRIAKLQNEIYEILKLLDSNQPILTPTQLNQKITLHCKYLENQAKKQKGYRSELSQSQYLMFQSLKFLIEDISPEDLHLLMKYHEQVSSGILTSFMQPFAYDKSITLGKIIGQQHLSTLFKKVLQDGFSSYRHSIVPFYLKKLIQAYSQRQTIWNTIVVNEIPIPKLVEIIQGKLFNSHLYSQLVSILIPQLFTPQDKKIKIIAPLLYLYTEYLLRTNHHKELVFTFIGQLAYEVVYFSNEAKLNALSNTMYTEDRGKISMKEKKILDVIREGGFSGYGFQLKNQIYSIIETHKSFRFPDEIIYNTLNIHAPLETLKFFRLLGSNTFINENIMKYGYFYKKHNFFQDILSQGKILLCFILVNDPSPFQFEEIHKQEEHAKEYNSISRRILQSESGIFQQMVTLNPKIKIAGIELSSAFKNLTDSRKKGIEDAKKRKGCISLKPAVDSIITQQTENSYEYIQLAISLKQKYVQYHLLTEQSKSYFRDCASSVVEKKDRIIEYTTISNKVKRLQIL